MLREMAEMFSIMDRSERIQALIDLGEKFKPVPAEVAAKPYPESHRVPHCESEAFVFWVPQDDGRLKFYFDVLNPQGISAKATAVILDRALSGAALDDVLRVDPDIIYDIFGRELSMGKNMGLTGMINMCKMAAGAAAKAQQ
jgi:cysteine desulfuration protein SufE